MRKRIYQIIFVALAGAFALLESCKNEAVPVPSEYISTMKIVAQNITNSTVDTFEYVNFNETRPNPPSYVDTIRLKAKCTYAIQVILLNETPTPTQNMTDTITNRGTSHLMIYDVDPSPGLVNVQLLDKDSKGLPLGLMSTWATTDTTNGWLRMILRHQPGHKNGTETPGNNDFEADFPVTVR